MNRALVEVKNGSKLGRTDFPVRSTEGVEQRQRTLEHLHSIANDQRIRTGNRV